MSKAKHDRQDVIQKATDLFWEKGFHATSMRNIQQAIDMRPGSIYASFGSKEGLFKETLQHYADTSLIRLNTSVRAASSPIEGLKLFIKDVVIGCRASAPSGMCMLVKTLSELTPENADLLAEAQRLLGTIETAFTALLVQAQVRGELDRSKDPERIARYLQVQLMGLRAYARANESDDQIRVLIEDVFDHLR
ncbi:MAG: TetR/AcrR family transcriptional repressor of nem operon [Motiliproteus sp.]